MSRSLLGVLAAIGLFTGCQEQNHPERVQGRRADAYQNIQHDEAKKAEVSQKEQEQVAQANQDQAKKVADARKDAEDDFSRLNRDEAKNQGKVAEANPSAPFDTTVANKMVEGTVKSTTFGNLKIIDSKGGELKFDTSKDTPVVEHGVAMKVGDLKEGQQVRAAYHFDNGKPIADRIEVIAGGATNPEFKNP